MLRRGRWLAVTEPGTRLKSLKIKGKPLVVIGRIDLNWSGVSFISLEEWFLGQGRQRLLNLLHLPAVDADLGPSPQELEQLLGQYLRFLNPGQILKITQQIVRDMGKDLHITLKPHHVINLVVHLSCFGGTAAGGRGKSVLAGPRRNTEPTSPGLDRGGTLFAPLGRDV
ncbi:PRD domain protein [Acididesulfobacillus acetoxydans]|uniref:PRD domain protein n=1 Tax=Acididesulfobacillus acetoxydans TaxID=1561005 RepID=A0A8S0X1W9_9FIRM|nr:PRD domain protein [Acididesulfobacillus acetoxydans]